MVKLLTFLFIILLIADLPLLGQEETTIPSRGDAVIHQNNIEYTPHSNLKNSLEKPFNIEAIYETSECSVALTSIKVYNAYFPLTWYELDEYGQRIHTLFNPELYYFNNQTTYVVEDFSKHTDTIYIEFEKSLAIEKVYPNPHRGTIFIQYSAIEISSMNIKLFDSVGRLVLSYDQDLHEGKQLAALELGHLEQGVYFLSLEGQCINELKKIIHLK